MVQVCPPQNGVSHRVVNAERICAAVLRTGSQVVKVRVDVDLVLPLKLGPHAPELRKTVFSLLSVFFRSSASTKELTCASLQ